VIVPPLAAMFFISSLLNIAKIMAFINQLGIIRNIDLDFLFLLPDKGCFRILRIT